MAENVQSATSRKRVAFVTYNSVAGVTDNVWMYQGEQSALVLQGVDQRNLPATLARLYQLSHSKAVEDERTDQAVEHSGSTSPTQSHLQSVVQGLDHLILYAGGLPAIKACLDIATGAGVALSEQIPPHKVTFVTCICDLEEKLRLLASAGFASCGYILSKCKGEQKMGELVKSFRETGLLPAGQPIESST